MSEKLCLLLTFVMCVFSVCLQSLRRCCTQSAAHIHEALLLPSVRVVLRSMSAFRVAGDGQQQLDRNANEGVCLLLLLSKCRVCFFCPDILVDAGWCSVRACVAIAEVFARLLRDLSPDSSCYALFVFHNSVCTREFVVVSCSITARVAEPLSVRDACLAVVPLSHIQIFSRLRHKHTTTHAYT